MRLMVLFENECHLLWADLCGYRWGKTSERLDAPISNTRTKQTYYGAIDLATRQCCIQTYDKCNSDSTIALLPLLMQQYPGNQLA
ncbi:transposase [Cyanobacteria bacterium FACHB-DQ100]|nr:transposase [Cyanobacteria bacterium FACHB-DQ100]MBD2079337.1 transposase [Leptolyngbya sp. FACHB-17]